MDGIDHATVIVEASSTIDRIVSMLPEHEIRVANPVKVRLISESMWQERNDAHILLDLIRNQYMPESYPPSKEIRETRNICRNRTWWCESVHLSRTVYVIRHTDLDSTSRVTQRRTLIFSERHHLFWGYLSVISVTWISRYLICSRRSRIPFSTTNMQDQS